MVMTSIGSWILRIIELEIRFLGISLFLRQK